MFGETVPCKGCGLAIDEHYWVRQPDFCHRCETTLYSLARRWREQVDETRTLTHIKFCREYADRFAHGAPGHLDMTVIALLAGILDDPGKVLR